MAWSKGFSSASSSVPSGHLSDRVVGSDPSGSSAGVKPVESPGGGIEHGDPAVGVAGDDPLVEGVEEHLEELFAAMEVGRGPADRGDVHHRHDRAGDDAFGRAHGLRIEVAPTSARRP